MVAQRDGRRRAGSALRGHPLTARKPPPVAGDAEPPPIGGRAEPSHRNGEPPATRTPAPPASAIPDPLRDGDRVTSRSAPRNHRSDRIDGPPHRRSTVRPPSATRFPGRRRSCAFWYAEKDQ